MTNDDQSIHSVYIESICIFTHIYTHIYIFHMYCIFIFIYILHPGSSSWPPTSDFVFFFMGPSTASGYKYQADTMPSFYEAAESMVVEAGFNNRDVLWPWDYLGLVVGWDQTCTSTKSWDWWRFFPWMTFWKDVGLLLGSIVDGGFQVVVASVLWEKFPKSSELLFLSFHGSCPNDVR